jgi:putative tryptophan/tyrosine transport system substrate-binding protein
MMERREFMAMLGAAAGWPFAARAQQPDRIRRLAVLVPFPKSDPVAQSVLAAFMPAFSVLGWSKERNIQIDFRWADAGFDQLQTIAKELVALKPDVIFAANGAPVVTALLQETRTIPIVFTGVSDPVGLGFVASLAKPGGNATGFSLYESSLGTKWLEALKRIAPQVRRIVLMYNPRTSVPSLYLPSIEAAAAALAVELRQVQALDPAEIEPAIAALSREEGGGLMLLPDTFTIVHRDRVVGLAAQYRLPAIYPLEFFATAGGLMSYGVDVDDLNRRAAGYVDRILKGASPADLPVQQPIKFELVINVRTAKALGLTVPPSLLASADEVIE